MQGSNTSLQFRSKGGSQHSTFPTESELEKGEAKVNHHSSFPSFVPHKMKSVLLSSSIFWSFLVKFFEK